MNKLYNKKVVEAVYVERDITDIKFLNIANHEGIKVTLEDGSKYLVHHGPFFGGKNGIPTVATDASNMKSGWRYVKNYKVCGEKTLGGLVAAMNKSSCPIYFPLANDCQDAQNRGKDYLTTPPSPRPGGGNTKYTGLDHRTDPFGREPLTKHLGRTGGVDLSYSALEPTNSNILGVKLTGDSCFFIAGSHTGKAQTTKISYLAAALNIEYNRGISHKNIAFSLDPYEETNPDGPFQRKVYYPDTSEGFPILENTDLGEVLFESDYIMKQLSLDTISSGNCSTVISQRLRNLGLKAINEFDSCSNRERDKKSNWSRCWLVIKNVEICKDTESFLISNVTIGVDARTMETDSMGKLIDKNVQDPNHGAYKFAKKFTEIYDEIAKEFSAFARLKEVVQAIVLAKFLKLNKVPVDIEKLKQSLQSNLNQNYSDKVSAIKRVAKSQTVSVNVIGNTEYSHITRTERTVFGGVSLEIKDWGALNSAKQSIPFEESKITVKQLNTTSQPISYSFFPFLSEKECKVCLETLSNEEIYLSQEQPFCKYHNPKICKICLKELESEYIVIQGINIHSECLKCSECYENIAGKYVVIDAQYFHPECGKLYNQREVSEEQVFKRNPMLLVKNIHEVFEGYFLEAECYEALKKNGGDQNLAIELLFKLKEIYDRGQDEHKEEIQVITKLNLEKVNTDVRLGKSQMREERDIDYLSGLNLGFDNSLIIEVYESCNKNKAEAEQLLFRLLD